MKPRRSTSTNGTPAPTSFKYKAIAWTENMSEALKDAYDEELLAPDRSTTSILSAVCVVLKRNPLFKAFVPLVRNSNILKQLNRLSGREPECAELPPRFASRPTNALIPAAAYAAGPCGMAQHSQHATGVNGQSVTPTISLWDKMLADGIKQDVTELAGRVDGVDQKINQMAVCIKSLDKRLEFVTSLTVGIQDNLVILKDLYQELTGHAYGSKPVIDSTTAATDAAAAGLTDAPGGSVGEGHVEEETLTLDDLSEILGVTPTEASEILEADPKPLQTPLPISASDSIPEREVEEPFGSTDQSPEAVCRRLYSGKRLGILGGNADDNQIRNLSKRLGVSFDRDDWIGGSRSQVDGKLLPLVRRVDLLIIFIRALGAPHVKEALAAANTLGKPCVQALSLSPKQIALAFVTRLEKARC